MAEIRVFSSGRCLSHEVPAGFPECPERLTRARSGLEGRWNMEDVGEGPDGWAGKARDLARRVHDPAYLERFEEAVATGARRIDTEDNPLSAGTSIATWAALEVCLATAEWVSGGEGRRGMALSRPPGHHAEHAMAMGFCYINHVAVVARALRDRGVERVAIVDFDVHHGNGTQHLFESSPDVLYISLHQAPFYPGTGDASERGKGEGVGTTLNLPLPAGTEGPAFLERFESEAVPALHDFTPGALLVSAGFDAWKRDPLGGMSLRRRDYRALGESLGRVAERHCEGRVLSILEGGYDLEALSWLVDAYLQGLSEV